MEQLELVIIPSKRYSIIIPKKIVIDTFPYGQPISSSFQNKALIGSLIYKNSKVPILDIEKLFESVDNQLDSHNEKKRLVILACISNKTKYNYYAIVAYNNVKTININEDEIIDVESITSNTESDIFYNKVEIKNKNEAYVLDLEKIEHNLLS